MERSSGRKRDLETVSALLAGVCALSEEYTQAPPELTFLRSKLEFIKAVDRAIETLNPKGSVSGALRQFGNNKGEVCECLGDGIHRLVLTRIQDLLSNDTCHDAWFAVDNNLVSEVRVFVKGEPHSKKKIETRRFRLIWAIGLVDEIISRLLHTGWIDNMASELGTGYDYIGVPHNNIGRRSLMARIARTGGIDSCDATDLSGFDFSHWSASTDALMTFKLVLHHRSSRLYHALMMRSETVTFNSVVRFSDGFGFPQCVFDGIEKSGKFTTGHDNCATRGILSRAIGYNVSESVGDDTLERSLKTPHPQPSSLAREFAKLGFTVKKIERHDGAVEFCSRIWMADPYGIEARPRLLSWRKMWYTFLAEGQRDFDERVTSIAGELYNQPDPVLSGLITSFDELVAANLFTLEQRETLWRSVFNYVPHPDEIEDDSDDSQFSDDEMMFTPSRRVT